MQYKSATANHHPPEKPLLPSASATMIHVTVPSKTPLSKTQSASATFQHKPSSDHASKESKLKKAEEVARKVVSRLVD